MALTRARVVVATPDFAARIGQVLREIVTLPRDPLRLGADIADMRARIAEQHGEKDPWDIKHRRGGLIDVEFITQYLQLRHGHKHPDAPHPTTEVALRRMAARGLVDPTIAEELDAALGLWHRVQAMQRLVAERIESDDELPDSLRKTLARGGGAVNFDTLRDVMEYTADRVRGHFEHVIGPPRRLVDRSEPGSGPVRTTPKPVDEKEPST
jgi:glutamate-ammonia-ligase adenylyltransferase